MEIGFLLLKQICVMFLLMLAGYVFYKKGMITDQGSKELGKILLYLVIPVVVINNFCIERTAEKAAELLQSTVLAGAAMLAAIVISHIVFGKRDGISCFSSAFSNAGFIALPLAQALIDTPESHEGSLYAAVYLAVFNIALWTWGLVNMSGEKKSINARKIILNPGIIGVVAGLIIFTSPLYVNFGEVSGIRLPGVIQDAISAVSALNLPLPMLMVGFYLAKADLLAAFRDGLSFICMAVRLVVFPMVLFAVLRILGVDGNVLIVSVIGASAPVGATTTIFSAKFGRDTELSVRLVSLSTIISMITMPLIVGLTQMVA